MMDWTEEAVAGRLLTLEILVTRQLGRVPGAEILLNEVAEVLRNLREGERSTLGRTDDSRIDEVFRHAHEACNHLRRNIEAVNRELPKKLQS